MKLADTPVVPLATAETAATRAAHWLARQVADGASIDAGKAMDALALVQVCRLVAGGECAAADSASGAVARAFPDLPWTGAPLSTSLLAAAAALREGGGIARRAGDYLQAFGELDDDLLEGANGAFVRLALGRASVVIAPPPPGLLLAGAAGIASFVDAVEAASRFGTVALSVEDPAPVLLEGAAMAALRAYDLPRGMRMLRARQYIEKVDQGGLAAGLDFVRLLQCDDGSFGDFDTAAAQLAADRRPDGELTLKLPVTWQSIWTLAELEEPGFRLAAAAFPGGETDERKGELHVVQPAD